MWLRNSIISSPRMVDIFRRAFGISGGRLTEGRLNFKMKIDGVQDRDRESKADHAPHGKIRMYLMTFVTAPEGVHIYDFFNILCGIDLFTPSPFCSSSSSSAFCNSNLQTPQSKFPILLPRLTLNLWRPTTTVLRERKRLFARTGQLYHEYVSESNVNAYVLVWLSG